MSKELLRWLSLPAMILTGAVVLTGCNTMEGFGEDVEEGGEEVSETSREVRD